MKVFIKDKEITLKYSFRGYMIFENVSQHTFTGDGGMQDMVVLFYSMIMGSDKTLVLTFEEFLDWLDENPMSFAEFGTWLYDNITLQSELGGEKEKKEGDVKEGDNDPKN